MDGFAIVLFFVALISFIGAMYLILTRPVPEEEDQGLTPAGMSLPSGSMIGAQCPVGCACFPNANATRPSDTPTQVCAFLSDNVMFSCPAQCCQPSCPA